MDDEEHIVETPATGSVTLADADEEMPVACIYVPSSESRTGWGMRMVYRSRQEEHHPIGFGRR